jgi:hypothetical protein
VQFCVHMGVQLLRRALLDGLGPRPGLQCEPSLDELGACIQVCKYDRDKLVSPP